MKKLLAMMIILLAGTAYAAIYVNENNNNVEYTDTPNTNSSKVEVPAVNSISSPKPAAPAVKTTSLTTAEKSPEDSAETTSTANTYQTFEIVSPANESTIQNQAVIPVEMKIEPNMLPGDKIQLMLDNKPVGTPTATSYQELGMVERGTHSLYAVIVNNKDQIIKQSSTMTIYVHRNSTVTSPAMQAR